MLSGLTAVASVCATENERKLSGDFNNPKDPSVLKIVRRPNP